MQQRFMCTGLSPEKDLTVIKPEFPSSVHTIFKRPKNFDYTVVRQNAIREFPTGHSAVHQSSLLATECCHRTDCTQANPFIY